MAMDQKVIYRDIVSALIFSKDRKLFMGMKDPSKGGVYVDCWHIPGGGVDEGEAKHESLERELKEEVGLEIDPAHFRLIEDSGEGESIKTVNDDLVKYEWAGLEDLGKYKLTPPSVSLFRKLGYILHSYEESFN